MLCVAHGAMRQLIQTGIRERPDDTQQPAADSDHPPTRCQLRQGAYSLKDEHHSWQAANCLAIGAALPENGASRFFRVRV
jgi:hypothetical protein